MTNLKIEAEIKDLKKILCDNDLFYQIPDYQRNYTWNKDNLSDLVDDLFNAYQNNKEEKYFCGSLVLVNSEKDKRYDIIDGQQRITTFIILSCVFRDFYIEDLGNKSRDYIASAIQDKYDEYKKKLTLLTDITCQNFFEEEVLKKIKPQKENRESIENKYPKNKYLQNAYYLIKFIQEKLKENAEVNINSFVEWIFENVVLTTITCPNQDTSIQIFNVLNDRGMPLSSVDILKSFLMHKLPDEGRKTFKNSWDSINNNLKESDLNMESLFRLYLYYTTTINQKTTLHKELLGTFKNQNPLELIHKIGNFAKAYIELLKSEDKYIYCLKYSTRYSIYWQSILTTAKFVEYKNIEGLKKILVAYYYQNWIAGGTTARIKQTSFNILKKVKEETHLDKIKEEIKKNLETYKTTSSFKEELKSNYVYDKTWSKPLLLLLEYFLKDDSNQSFIPLDKEIHIEHILPQNSEENSWGYFNDDDKEKWTNALANLTLLSMRKNIQAKNKSFKCKKEAYTKKDNVATSFELTRQIFENDEWNLEILEKRQNNLIDEIKKILDIFLY